MAGIGQPSGILLIVDEHPDFITGGMFQVQVAPTPLSAGTFPRDLPSSLHNGAAVACFTDGHTEVHKWNSNITKAPVRYVGGWVGNIPFDSDTRDHAWMLDHCSEVRPQ